MQLSPPRAKGVPSQPQLLDAKPEDKSLSMQYAVQRQVEERRRSTQPAEHERASLQMHHPAHEQVKVA